jgi:HEAT repeat protein
MKRHPFQTNLRRLLVVVACFGIIAWAWRRVEDARRPPSTRDWVRALQSGSDEERKLAASKLASASAVDAGIVIAALANALADTSPSVRSEAASSLGRYASSSLPVAGPQILPEIGAAEKALIAVVTRDGDSTVRSSAAFAIASILLALRMTGVHPEKSGGSALVDLQVVVAAFSSALAQDPGNRHALIRPFFGLGQTGLPAPAALLAALDDPSKSVRVQTLLALSHFGSGADRAIAVLLRDLETEEDHADRRAAGMSESAHRYLSAAKGLHPSPAVLPALIEALECKNRNVAVAAAVLLGQMGESARPAAPALIAAARKRIPAGAGPNGREDGLFADFAPELLRVLPPDEAATILCEALRPNRDSTRSAAASALAELGPKGHAALPTLVQTMKDASALREQDDSRYARAVVTALGQIAPQAPATEEVIADVLEALGAGLDFEDPVVRNEAALALAKFGPRASRALPKLRAIVKTEAKFKYVRESAAKSIESIAGSPSPAGEPAP